MASKGKGNSADIESKTRVGRRKVRTFTLHPTRRRRLDPKSTKRSQNHYVRLKAALILSFVESVLQADTAHERFIGRRVLDKVAQKFDGAVRERHYEFKTLDMKESVILRDGINASTNGMVKLASMINAMR